MRITNRTRNTLLGAKVTLASGWLSRLRGYIGRPEPRPGEGILLLPCNAIHTFWMAYEIDVLFLDEKGRVLKVIEALRPWKWTRKVPEARYVLEVPVGTLESSGTRAGDELSWREPIPYSLSVLKGNRGIDVSAPTVGGRSTA